MKIENLKLKIESGFTLIELLIVIALLGALAVGLLATVDPFEQLKKGTDTSRRNTTTELWNAAVRYYAQKNDFPWTEDLTARNLSDSTMTDSSTGYLTKIITAGELKPDFIELAGGSNLSKIFLTSTSVAGVRENVAVCFRPESKSFQIEKNTQFNSDSALRTDCKSQDSTADCYWCIK